MSRVRVKHKGQVTIPQQIRTEFGIEEGAILEISREDDKIVLKPLPPLEPGEPVGEEEFKKILAELEERREKLALTGAADTRLLFYMEVPPNLETGRRIRDFFEKELRQNLIVPTVVLAEFMEIVGARIGEEAAKNRIRLLKERGMQIVEFDEQHALKTGSLLLSNRNVPIADAIIASYVKSGEADYVLTDDNHFKTLNIKTKWIP